MSDLVTVKRALISVSNKADLIPFARHLAGRGVEIISTGGTAKALTAAGIAVIPIEQLTGFPEMMDGRVKTLHPRVHGGLLALHNPEHQAAMTEHGIEPIDLVCINLYPFEETVAKQGVTFEQAIEQIDIGGPSMIRSAAKNHRFVTVVTDPSQYDHVISALEAGNGATTGALRRDLALAAFARTAAYDTAIASWLSQQSPSPLPSTVVVRMARHCDDLRYGENPHQQGALYLDATCREASVAHARQLHGKTLSFCNLYDANGALELAKEVDGTQHAAAAVIKHANPCGFAIADDLATAFNLAYAGDPLAAFGGIVALNRTVDRAAAEAIVAGQKFLEVIIAPGYDADALELLRDRWKNIRLLETGPLPAPAARDPRELDMKRITGGLLVQQRDLSPIDPSTWEHKAGPKPDEAALRDMAVATIAVRHLKSNAVCLVANAALVGAGAGQMDRMTSCHLAVQKAGERARGSVAGSDAFFPFRDGPDKLIAAGVRAIAQTGGSMRDSETIAACEEAGVTLMFTGRRLFRH